MNQNEIVTALNRLNLQLTEMQKVVVATISKLQRRGLDQPELVSPVLARIGEPLVHHPDEVTQSVPPELMTRVAPLFAEHMGGVIEPEQPGKVMDKVVASLAATLAVDQPELAKAPDHSDPNQTTALQVPHLDHAAMKREEMRRDHLLEMIYGSQGLLARWFSNEVYPDGKGDLKPISQVNLYRSDISKLPHARLASWPDGFYTNAKTSAYQYLLHGMAHTFVIEFGDLMSPEARKRNEAIRVFFLAEGMDTQPMFVSHLGNTLVEAIYRSLNEILTLKATLV